MVRVELRFLSPDVYCLLTLPKKEQKYVLQQRKMFGTSFGRSWDMKNRPCNWNDFPEKSRKTGIMGMTTIRSLSGKGGKIPEGGFNLAPSQKKHEPIH